MCAKGPPRKFHCVDTPVVLLKLPAHTIDTWIPVSTMSDLGLPDHIVDIITRQNSTEGVKLEWAISGREGLVEVKLKWKTERGPSGDEKNMPRKYKSQGNIRRDFFHMKMRLMILTLMPL